jgi:WD40 repeat protein
VRPTAATKAFSVHAGFQANGNSGRASISPDGRYVIFASDATNLVGGDSNNHGDTFVYDLQAYTFQRVSIGPDGIVQDDGGSTLGADISFPPTPTTVDVFVADLTAGTVGAVVEDDTTPAFSSLPANTLSTQGTFTFADRDLSDIHSSG